MSHVRVAGRDPRCGRGCLAARRSIDAQRRCGRHVAHGRSRTRQRAPRRALSRSVDRRTCESVPLRCRRNRMVQQNPQLRPISGETPTATPRVAPIAEVSAAPIIMPIRARRNLFIRLCCVMLLVRIRVRSRNAPCTLQVGLYHEGKLLTLAAGEENDHLPLLCPTATEEKREQTPNNNIRKNMASAACRDPISWICCAPPRCRRRISACRRGCPPQIEVSVVDIGANDDALQVGLYHEGKLLTLAAGEENRSVPLRRNC